MHSDLDTVETQDRPFWNAKRPVSGCSMWRFGERNSLSGKLSAAHFTTKQSRKRRKHGRDNHHATRFSLYFTTSVCQQFGKTGTPRNASLSHLFAFPPTIGAQRHTPKGHLNPQRQARSPRRAMSRTSHAGTVCTHIFIKKLN